MLGYCLKCQNHNMASVSLFTAVHVHITLRNCMLKRNCATNIVATHWDSYLNNIIMKYTQNTMCCS